MLQDRGGRKDTAGGQTRACIGIQTRRERSVRPRCGTSSGSSCQRPQLLLFLLLLPLLDLGLQPCLQFGFPAGRLLCSCE